MLCFRGLTGYKYEDWMIQ